MTFHDDSSVPSSHTLVLDSASRALALPDRLRMQQLHLFYGDLHNHTGYSDGTGRPIDALRQMRDRGLHFAAITDHGEFLDRPTKIADVNKWAAAAEQVAAIAGDEFVAIRGFEWSSPRQGHSNVWWSSHYTGAHETGDESMAAYYEWLADAEPVAGGQVLAGFNHPGRELVCFDGCTYAPSLDQRIVTLECFNRDDDYGTAYFRALDQGWHVGAIGVSDHHGDDWGSPRLPRAGLLAPTLSTTTIRAALINRRVFATRSPTLALLIAGNSELMGARLTLHTGEPLMIGVWCNDPAADTARSRVELWTNGGTLLDATEARGLSNVSWQVMVPPQAGTERWYVVRVLYGGNVRAYSSPIWARWNEGTD